ncbi:unnamed protein product [Thelazia callipaeda]|uniref:Integrase_SAM-like_N domain-containing protein n=1 Tax=Thelazia callipaeda TaxID=103827 RepID=A0A0N5CWR5_THECL|nr:unnamed protein product [Thelazia callipaeda]
MRILQSLHLTGSGENYSLQNYKQTLQNLSKYFATQQPNEMYELFPNDFPALDDCSSKMVSENERWKYVREGDRPEERIELLSQSFNSI